MIDLLFTDWAEPDGGSPREPWVSSRTRHLE
jgi:hypothetical protein